jgi:4-hydroxy-tetrahydrodipicolinate synthase
MRIIGSWVAIPTPFNDDGTINFDAFKSLINFHEKHQTDGLLVLGSAGETSMLNKIEKQEIIEFVSKYAKRKIPVFVGTTASNTSETIAMTKFAKQCDSDGALMVVPGYIIPPQEAIYDFFKEVATTVDIPIAIYNNPTRVGVNIQPETAIRLAKIPNIVAIKQAYPEVSHLIKIKKALGDNIDILPCDAPSYSIILPCLAIGGSGVTNITGNLAPEEFAQLSKPWKNFNDVIKSRELVFKFYELMEICYSVTNPVAIKAGLNLLGFSVGKPRLPLQELNQEKTIKLKETMEKLGILKKYKI